MDKCTFLTGLAKMFKCLPAVSIHKMWGNTHSHTAGGRVNVPNFTGGQFGSMSKTCGDNS